MTITTAQIRAARGLLNWSQSELALRTGISATSIGAIENGNSTPREHTLQLIKKMFEESGIEFTDFGGVQPRRYIMRLYQGATKLKQFMDDVYETASKVGGDICLFNTTPGNWLKVLGEEWCTFHYKRMMEVKDRFNFRAITKEDNDLLIGQGFITYKWIPKHLFDERTFYCYGDKLAFLDFTGPTAMIWVMEHKGFADGFRTLFEISWNNATDDPVLDVHQDFVRPVGKKEDSY